MVNVIARLLVSVVPVQPFKCADPESPLDRSIGTTSENLSRDLLSARDGCWSADTV
jgi:hypothetical protein